MSRTTDHVLVRTIEPHTRLSGRLRDLVRYRELLVNLVRKELKVKYKNSALGFAWSMLNPALYLVIFYIVFTYFLPAGIPYFPIYLVSGLLAWNLWSASLGGSVASILGNANLVTKVYFPREILPLSTIGASVIHFFLQFIVLIAALAVFRYSVNVEAVWLVPLALVVQLLLLLGVCLIVAVLNVYFRDVQHLLELVLLAWFWMTPIVYPIVQIQEKNPWVWRLYLLNPMTHIVLAFQRGIYGLHEGVTDLGGGVTLTWYLRNLTILGAIAIALIAFGWWMFRRLESRLAEEL
jgi:ABC-2 type transport system permease protein